MTILQSLMMSLGAAALGWMIPIWWTRISTPSFTLLQGSDIRRIVQETIREDARKITEEQVRDVMRGMLRGKRDAETMKRVWNEIANGE